MSDDPILTRQIAVEVGRGAIGDGTVYTVTAGRKFRLRNLIATSWSGETRITVWDVSGVVRKLEVPIALPPYYSGQERVLGHVALNNIEGCEFYSAVVVTSTQSALSGGYFVHVGGEEY